MTAQASPDFPTDPILRLDPEGHSAAIIRIDVDAQGRWLVSSSHDKTIKVWRLAATLGGPSGLRLADAERGQATPTETVAELLPARIRILSPAPDTSLDSQKLVLLYQSESRENPVTSVEARIDGRPAEVLEHVQPTVTDGGRRIVGQITLAVPPRDGVAELIAATRTRPASRPPSGSTGAVGRTHTSRASMCWPRA